MSFCGGMIENNFNKYFLKFPTIFCSATSKKNNNQHQVDLWQIFGKQLKEKPCFMMMKLQVSKIPEKLQKPISVIRGSISGTSTKVPGISHAKWVLKRKSIRAHHFEKSLNKTKKKEFKLPFRTHIVGFG